MESKLEFSERARDNLLALRKRGQQVIADSIEVHLRNEPDKPTRKRKRLEENPLAPWELRIGDFRAFYDVDRDAAIVVILAIGQKVHNKLYIGGEEIEL